ncbi:hypothetical protein RND81_09G252200 [Saponaria officinalis]|uniref:Uncharacterized protein n=1 Tax=Saponaria officinalis TaxID=3572 RepID=A0AAW1IQE0_SAPOF
MASTKASDKNQKAELHAIMSTEVAKSLITGGSKDQDQPGVAGAVTNNRGQTLQLLATTSWIGEFYTAPPASVGAGVEVQFAHGGSKGALIYGQQQSSSNAAAYLLAWSFGNGPPRVYVGCGPVSEVYYSGWENAALTNLNSSGAESSASNGGTSSKAQAAIQDESGTFPLGVVVASFY